MSASVKKFINPATRFSLQVALLLILGVALGVSQKTSAHDSSPRYDLQTETKVKGVVEEINLVTFGTRKDFTELVVKSADDNVHMYLCPKPFQEEIGISFNKDDQVAVTGSKVKQGTLDVILARELVKGTDTVQFRDEKGKPVWDERTGK